MGQHQDILPSVVEPGAFDAPKHFYERVLNAHIHPLVRYFFGLGNERIAERYCHLHPQADIDAVRAVLQHSPTHFRWGGSDLFHITSEEGRRHIVVIETNSCPSGQKSMPQLAEGDEHSGYRLMLEQTFVPRLKGRSLPAGELAVLYDKNLMEASGYAATLAEMTNESVHLVPFMDGAADPHARFTDEGVLEIRPAGQKGFIPIRAALRYVTQRPWNRIPPITKTLVVNPVLVCLAGGRNKLLAAKAYDLFNAKRRTDGLHLETPETIWDAGLEEVPLWVNRMGGCAVIKAPYSNAGQGVFTITSEAELEAFMASEHRYDRFVVQALIGNLGWSSVTSTGSRLYHVGTVPDKRGHIFVSDLRLMVAAGSQGFRPVAFYARRARVPLAATSAELESSWDALGTNLSVKLPDGSFTTQPERLLLMDSRDFNRLGLGLDDLVDAYLQTVMAMTSVDEMASQLVNKKKRFRRRLFASLNPDPTLLEEIKLAP